MNKQTRGPVTRYGGHKRRWGVRHSAGSLCQLTRGDVVGQEAASAKLLAAAYTAFDKAGRALGIDAAELAETLDIAAIVRALWDIGESIDEDNPDSYINDDPHNCLEVVADDIRTILATLPVAQGGGQ